MMQQCWILSVYLFLGAFNSSSVLANDGETLDENLVAAIAQYVNEDKEILNVQRINVAERDLIYFIVVGSSYRDIAYKYFDINSEELLTDEEFQELREIQLMPNSDVIVSDRLIEKKAALRSNAEINVFVSLRPQRNWNSKEGTALNGSANSVKDNPHARSSGNKPLQKAVRSRERMFDTISNYRWNLNSTKIKLTSSQARIEFLKINGARVMLNKHEIDDIISNGGEVISSLGVGDVEIIDHSK